MQKSSGTADYRGLLLSIFVLGLAAALFVAPNLFRSEAGSNGKGLIQRTESHDPNLENYDIRNDKAAFEIKSRFRQESGKDASSIADVSENFVRGENELRTRVSTLKVDYSTDLRVPQVITPDVWKNDIQRLSSPSSEKRSEILRNFVKQNSNLIGVDNAQADALQVTADYTNPNGYMSFAHLEQRINGVQVYRAEIKAGFTKSGEMIRVLNDLAPGINYETVSTDFGDPLNAVRKSFSYINAEPTRLDIQRNDAASTDLKVVFGNGDWATTAEKLYFPIEIGVVRPSWRVLIWQPVNAFYVIVDAETGMMLSRENITADQTQAATYNVYANPNGFINSADSPAPLTPGPIDPSTGTQGALIANRTNITRIGNEAPNPGQNNLGWITDGANITDGNNVEAGIDRDGTNGVDAPQTGTPNRVFDAPTWNPPPGNPTPGDDPLTPQAQRGAVIQMFYVMNLYHDALYSLGFTEQARNFQNDNFGRGGAAADRVSAEGQDSSGTNNANFSTPADGGRGRMQMFLWTGPTPDKDGTTDIDVVIHEVTHGTSTRLHNNAMGNQGAMMGEGWSDWYGHTMLAEASDPINGIYTTGGYATHLLSATFTSNYYYGIRRFPKAVIAFTGGPNNRPHNPLTFGHLNAGCDTTLGTTTTAVSSAYPRSPVIATAGNCSQVHNAGEIWSSALWEVRALMVTRLGFAAGTRRVLQVVTDGMKLAPQNPMMLQERDAIIAAASALPAAPQAAADVLDVREGFRRRGMGFSAQTISATSVVEAFDAADVSANAATVTSGNGLLEPNECNTINVPLTNNSGNAATNITAVLSSTTPGITVTQANSAYPDIPGGAGPINNTTPYQVSVDNTVACFTSAAFTLTVTYTGGGGGSPETFNFSLPIGQAGVNYAFTQQTGQTIPTGGTFITGSDDDDFVVAVPLPAGWASTVYGTTVTSLSASTNGHMTVNGAATTAFTNAALPATTLGSGPTLAPYWDDLDMDVADVTGGGIFVNTVGTAPNRQLYVEWKAQHFSETVNGPISTNFAILLTEGSDVVRYVYASTGIGAQLNGASATVGIQKTNTAAADFTQFSFNTTSLSAGLQLTGTRPPGVCSPGTGTCGTTAVPESRADFDGDGKTDISVFRPSNGGWYLQRSTAGFTGITWGTNGDVIVPGDYDGDNKTDTAVFRASNSAGVADFYILNSNGFTLTGYEWGSTGDIPVVGDYDGDDKDDVAVFRPSESRWYIRNSGNGSVTIHLFGTTGDIPMVMDYDGDGKANITVYRNSNLTWYIARATGVPGQNFDSVPFGSASDLIVPADYDGDNKDDIAMFRPSNGTWFIRKTSDSSVYTVPFGLSGDVPVPGDYDGDGKDDQAVYRNGTWYANRSTSGFLAIPFGLATDKPAPKAYIP